MSRPKKREIPIKVIRNVEENRFEKLLFGIHPRVFESLGNDLVTDDVVAVIELVKNSYDALAHNVYIKFFEDESGDQCLEIEDDGCGMTEEVLRESWCVVATPFKARNPVVKRGKKKRRVVGDKGLGRLSALRLGERLHMLTRAENSPCWEIEVDWAKLLGANSLSESFVSYRRYIKKLPFSTTEVGTRLTIHGLRNRWNENRVSDLRNALARLVSPFAKVGEFNIFLSDSLEAETEKVRIEAPEFLSKPKYVIKGKVEDGNIKAKYEFTPIWSAGVARRKLVAEEWKNIRKQKIFEESIFSFSEEANCGPFSFEIRAWDIAPEDTEEIAERFNLQKNQIRRAIATHKGISIYRDGVLVLPKSDKTRDWMGLDLRRVSRLARLSTNQIVGYVSISAENNPGIQDTSDRERLVSCVEVMEFEAILSAIIAKLENERDIDRRDRDKEEQKTESLFDQLSAGNLLDEVVEISGQGGRASKVIPVVKRHSKRLEATKRTLQKRFVYYSRLATIGTIAAMLVHEIRNRTTIIGSFLNLFKIGLKSLSQNRKKRYDRAVKAVDALERLSDTFLPLASRNFKRRRRRYSVLEKHIKECVNLRKNMMDKLDIKCRVPKTETRIAVDPGELDAIILNLLENAEYWLGNSDDKREIQFRLERINRGRRVRVFVHDTGPGIDDDNVEKIFWPGVTSKPKGIGMGLTVAAELVAAYGGDMSTIHPGEKGGASFAFDLPVQKQSQSGELIA